MSIYGDLSKAQRKLLTALFYGIQAERAVTDRGKGRIPAGPAKTAVSAATALYVDGKGRQTARSLQGRGLVELDPNAYWRCRVWLTPAGLKLMRSLDFRHSRCR